MQDGCEPGGLDSSPRPHSNKMAWPLSRPGLGAPFGRGIQPLGIVQVLLSIERISGTTVAKSYYTCRREDALGFNTQKMSVHF